jgi:hypothetical protein
VAQSALPVAEGGRVDLDAALRKMRAQPGQRETAVRDGEHGCLVELAGAKRFGKFSRQRFRGLPPLVANPFIRAGARDRLIERRKKPPAAETSSPAKITSGAQSNAHFAADCGRPRPVRAVGW